MSGQLDSLRAFMGASNGGSGRGLHHVIVIAAGKGGVGTSTVSALVAAAAANAGRSTLLIDAAASAGSLGVVLGVDADSTPDVGAEPTPRFIAPCLSFLALAAAAGAGQGERRARMRRVSARYAEHELVLIDAGASADGVMTALSGGAGRLLAVTTADRLAIVATYALIKLAGERSTGLPIAVLVNRSNPGDATRAFGQIAAACDEFLTRRIVPAGAIPEDEDLRAAADAGASPAVANGDAVQAASLLSELLLHAGYGRHGRPALINST